MHRGFSEMMTSTLDTIVIRIFNQTCNYQGYCIKVIMLADLFHILDFLLTIIQFYKFTIKLSCSFKFLETYSWINYTGWFKYEQDDGWLAR